MQPYFIRVTLQKTKGNCVAQTFQYIRNYAKSYGPDLISANLTHPMSDKSFIIRLYAHTAQEACEHILSELHSMHVDVDTIFEEPSNSLENFFS